MERRSPLARPDVTALGAGAVGRLALVAGALLVLWSAIGWVVGWWG